MKKEKWVTYKVSWLFLSSLCGSVPADPDIRLRWIESRMPKVKPPGARSIEQIQVEIANTLVAEAQETDRDDESLLVFQRVDGNLVMRAGTVRAHIKDCARIVSSRYVGKIEGEASFSKRVLDCVYPDPGQYWLPILSAEGLPIREVSGVKEKAVHVWTRMGTRNALKAIEFVNHARIDFRLKIFGGNVSRDDLETLFEYGGVHGYAGERGDGEGKYVANIELEETINAGE
jgi:hypothetical protein